MKFNKSICVVLMLCILLNTVTFVAFAETPMDLVADYPYSYTYADIDFDKKDNWNDTVNFNQLGYGMGTGNIDIFPSGVGNNGNSAKLSTQGKIGVDPEVLKVSFDFLCTEFTSEEIGCDLKFGSTWYSGLHIKKHSQRSGYGVITLWGSTLATIEADTWHNISYIINSRTSKYTLYIDNVEKNTLDFAGSPNSVQIASGQNPIYVDNAFIQVVNASDYSFARSVNNQTFDDASTNNSGWIDTALQCVSGNAEFTQYRYHGVCGKSMKLSNNADFRFFTRREYTSADSFGETTQINNIRAEVSSGIVIYSADFLFKDFLTDKGYRLNSFLKDGSNSWMLGGFIIPATGTGRSCFETTGVSSGIKSKTITINQWYTATLVVDLDKGKMYHFVDNIQIASANFSQIGKVYRASVTADATDYSVMYLDNVNITAYSKIYNTPSVFEDDKSLKSELLGYGAIHLNSGCIIRPDGIKILSDCIPVKTDSGTMVDSSVVYALFGRLISDVTAEVFDGTPYYSIEECISKSGKKWVYSDDAKNGGFYIIGDNVYRLPTGENLQKLNDYIFYLRPDSDTIVSLYSKSNLKAVHPRLLATQENFQTICTLAKKDGSQMHSIATQLMEYADWVVNHTNIITYSKNYGDDLRMNNRASEFDEYMYSLAVAWQVARTLNPQKAEIYKNYAWKNIASVASFPDWNPAHHIDLGIFSSGFAIAYDMMYEAWNDEQRQIMEKAALKNGLEWFQKSYQITYSAMTNAAYVENNHNAMTNGNAVLLALAFMDVYPDECSYVLSNAVRGMENMLINYAPEGAWWEGVFYSALNMTYLCPAFEALENVLQTCLRLDTVQGYDGAGDFIDFAQSDVGIYNFADAELTNCTPNVWYQMRFGRNWGDLFDKISDGTLRVGGKSLAVTLMAYDNSIGNTAELPLDKYFENTQLVTMHDSYKNGQTFVGIKAGETVYAHSHFDAGSYVYDWNGVRWAHDMGKDDYNLPGFWENDGGRWKVFLNRAESHNTIIVDPDMNPDYKIGSSASITDYITSTDGGVVKIDTSDLYDGRLSDAKRAYCFTDSRKSLVIRDELVTIAGKTSVIYSMLYTQAVPSVDNTNKRVILSDETDPSKKVMVEFLCSNDFSIVIENAKPLPGTPVVEGQRDNEGFCRVALKTSATGNVSITTKITPFGVPATDISDYDISISDWDEDMIRSDFEQIVISTGEQPEFCLGIFALYSGDGVLKSASVTELSPYASAEFISNPYIAYRDGNVRFFTWSKNNLRPLNCLFP